VTDLRLQPQNLNAEKALLGSQMIDARKVDEIRDIVSPKDFYADTHAAIQKAILKLRDSGADLDVVLITQQLDSTGDLADIGGVPYIMELMEAVPHAEHAKHYAKIVAACSRRRSQLSVAKRLMESAYDMTADEIESSETAMKAATELADITPQSRIVTMADAVNGLIDDLEAGTQPAVRVMIPAIDDATGGAAPGEMFIIGARPSHGKSLFALQSLDTAAGNGWPGLIISEEMAALSLAGRMLSSITVLPSGDWMRETSRLRFDAREHFGNRAPILIAEKCATAAGAERAIASAVRTHGIKIVAVDYAQLLRGDGDNEQERIGDVSQRMKAMAMKYDLIVLLLAQLNRGIESRPDPTPGLADLRGSGSLEQDADVVLFPMWPFKLQPTYEDRLEYRIYQAKNRNRGVGSPIVGMRINPERQRLESIAQPETDVDRESRTWN